MKGFKAHFDRKTHGNSWKLFFNWLFDPLYAGCWKVSRAQMKAENLNFHVVWSKVPAPGVMGVS